MYWHYWSLLFLWLAAPLHVAGQSSNVTKCVASYDWSINSIGQTPCLVAAYLESLCGVPTSVDAIPNGTHYLGPTSPSQQDECKCSTVTYSAVSACGGCQGRTFQNWTTWSQFCSSVEIATFPKIIPAEVEVPLWAYINVTLTGNDFNPVAAQQVIASGLPSSSVPAPTSTSSSTQTSSTSSSSPATSSSAASNSSTSSKSHSNAGAIAGGVIGGLVVLVGVCLLFLWRYVSKKRNAVQKDLTFDSRALVSGQPTGGTMMSQTTGFTSRSPESYSYGPSPVTFSQSHQPSGVGGLPLSPATTAVYTSPPQASRRSLESVSPSLAQFGGYQAQPNSQGGYRGAAEV